MLVQRITTAVFLLIFVLAALFNADPIWWQIIISIFLLVGAWEWSRFSQLESAITQGIYVLLFAMLWIIVQYFVAQGQLAVSTIAWSGVVLWLLLILFTTTRFVEGLHQQAIKLAIGFAVLLVAGSLVVAMKSVTHGILWLLCFFVSVWAADIGAFFVGRRFGKTKLAPSISPGKTVEGLAGGIALTLLIFVPVLFTSYSLPSTFDSPLRLESLNGHTSFGDFSTQQAWLVLFAVLITALVSVVGDLFESKMKRFVGMKDSSQVLPGHGGVLDRIDSLLAGAPFFSIMLLCIGVMA